MIVKDHTRFAWMTIAPPLVNCLSIRRWTYVQLKKLGDIELTGFQHRWNVNEQFNTKNKTKHKSQRYQYSCFNLWFSTPMKYELTIEYEHESTKERDIIINWENSGASNQNGCNMDEMWIHYWIRKTYNQKRHQYPCFNLCFSARIKHDWTT